MTLLAPRGVLLAAALALAGLRPASAEGEAPPSSRSPVDEARRAAIRRGCEYLADRQNAGGHFGDNKAIVAITALSTLALMSDGSGMRRGPHGARVQRAVEFLLGLVEAPSEAGKPDGYFHFKGDATSRMHGQGYATLTLASALGSADTASATRIRSVLRRAVACAEASQTGTGGWGYDPEPAGEHEGSVTVTVAQGLRAARDAGILVNADTVRRGLHYLRKSQRLEPVPGDGEDGSFKYSLTTDRSSHALTAAAISSFFLFGEYPGPRDPQDRIRRGVRYLQRTTGAHLARREWLYYGNFYAAWAAWQLDGDGRPGPDSFWPVWHRRVYPLVLAKQAADGSWHDDEDKLNFGDLLPTAFAVLTLAIPDEQIPIFQR